jgi:hypothetical protein
MYHRLTMSDEIWKMKKRCDPKGKFLAQETRSCDLDLKGGDPIYGAG